MTFVYRTCSFDDSLGAVLSLHQQEVNAEQVAMRDLNERYSTRFAASTAVSDVSEATNAVFQALGTNESVFRAEAGLPPNLATIDAKEEWLANYHGIGVVRGKYVIQTNGVDLAPYRVLYEALGLGSLEALLTSGVPYAYYVQHEAATFSGTSLFAVAATYGIKPSALERVVFAWLTAPSKAIRPVLALSGFSDSEAYSVVRGTSTGKVVVVQVPRTDLFVKLRAMGYSTADLEVLLRRTKITKVRIDNQTRLDDAENAWPGPYLSIPFPSEIAADLSRALQRLAIPGSLLTPSGVALLYPPATVLLGLIDVSSFGLGKYLYDSLSMGRTREAQTFLAMTDYEYGEILSTLASISASVGDSIGAVASALECVLALSGGNCGPVISIPSQSSGTAFALSIATMYDTLSVVAGPFSLQVRLQCSMHNALIASIEKLASTPCFATKNLPDKGADGGPFDQDGGTFMAMHELSSVCGCITSLLGAHVAGARNTVTNMREVQSNRNNHAATMARDQLTAGIARAVKN